MSKAFTKEDDDAGVKVVRSGSLVVPAGPFRVTKRGAEILAASDDPRVRAAMTHAEIVAPSAHPDRAALGVTVRVDAHGEPREYRLVTPEEQGLTGDGCSVQSPVGRALLGAEIGEIRELRTPRGVEEIEIVGLEG